MAPEGASEVVEMNVVFLQGRLSSDPVLRELSSGSRLLSLEVTTDTDAGSANVPVAWFDPATVPDWLAGVDVVVRGIVKRRFYRGPSGTQTRTEVVALEVCEVTTRRQAQRLLEHAVSALGAS
jgi:single-stranded DNA-binding protein